jgi:AcrR family transcriptional regulator
MEEVSTLTRKEREKLSRKKDIMDAAAVLFSVKGFDHTTLEEIAAKAEFGTGTIYNYFQSKEEIFRSIIESVFDANIQLLEACSKSTNTFVDFLRLYTQRVFDYFSQNKEALLILASMYIAIGEKAVKMKEELIASRNCDMDDIIMQKIKEGIKNKEIKKVNPEYLGHVFHNLLFPYITNLIKSNKLNESEINLHVNFILDVLFNGILIR